MVLHLIKIALYLHKRKKLSEKMSRELYGTTNERSPSSRISTWIFWKCRIFPCSDFLVKNDDSTNEVARNATQEDILRISETCTPQSLFPIVIEELSHLSLLAILVAIWKSRHIISVRASNHRRLDLPIRQIIPLFSIPWLEISSLNTSKRERILFDKTTHWIWASNPEDFSRRS